MTISDIDADVTIEPYPGSHRRKLSGDLDLTTVSGNIDYATSAAGSPFRRYRGTYAGEAPARAIRELQDRFRDIDIDLENAWMSFVTFYPRFPGG